MEGLPVKTWPKGKAVSACGLSGLRVIGSRDGNAVPWPPRVASLPDGTTRCRECYSAVPVRKVRSEFRQLQEEHA